MNNQFTITDENSYAFKHLLLQVLFTYIIDAYYIEDTVIYICIHYFISIQSFFIKYEINCI